MPDHQHPNRHWTGNPPPYVVDELYDQDYREQEALYALHLAGVCLRWGIVATLVILAGINLWRAYA